MKKCDKCGYENRDAAKFCNDCGAPLPSKAKKKESACPKCGAIVPPDANFCGACGARIVEEPPKPVVCSGCGAPLAADVAFCTACGKPVGGLSAADGAPADPAEQQTVKADGEVKTEKPRAARGKIAAAKARTLEFEKKHCLIVNLLIAALAIIVIFVSLFAPIKVNAELSDITDSVTGSTTSDDSKYATIDQSFWQVLGALGYVSLDIDSDKDFDKIEELYDDFQAVCEEAGREFVLWYYDHPTASDKRMEAKLEEIVRDKLSGLNYFAYELAFTTEGVMDYLAGFDVESSMSPNIEAERTSTIISLIQGVLIVALCLAMAIISIVFLILAIVGACKKFTNIKLFTYLTVMLGLSGAGLILSMVSPMLVAGGAVLAISIVSALAYLVCALVQNFVECKNPMVAIKNGIFATLAVVTFYVLCAYIVDVSVSFRMGTTKTESNASSPLGAVIMNMIYILFMVVKGDFGFSQFMGASVAATIIALALGLIMIVLMYIALCRSLSAIRKGKNNDRFAMSTMIAAFVIMLLFAILPPAIGSASKLPAYAENDEIYFIMNIRSLAPVYVSLVFSVIAIAFGFAFNPKTNKPVETSTVAE